MPRCSLLSCLQAFKIKTGMFSQGNLDVRVNRAALGSLKLLVGISKLRINIEIVDIYITQVRANLEERKT